jgi:hypothetical protein
MILNSCIFTEEEISLIKELAEKSNSELLVAILEKMTRSIERVVEHKIATTNWQGDLMYKQRGLQHPNYIRFEEFVAIDKDEAKKKCQSLAVDLLTERFGSVEIKGNLESWEVRVRPVLKSN